MGASVWAHIGRYNGDLASSIQNLCQRVFEEGDYYNIWVHPDVQRAQTREYADQLIARYGLEHELEKWTINPKGIPPTSREDLIELFLYMQGMRDEPPRTIEELLEYNELTGTHSILDRIHNGTYWVLPIEQIVSRFEPITPRALIEVYGTDRPTRAMVDAHEGTLCSYVLGHADEGNYHLIYDGDEPTEIFIMGVSGD